MNGPGAPLYRRLLICAATLAGIHFLAPWPGPQAVLHAFLVLGLAPGFEPPVHGMAWAALGGWVLEGSLRSYPHLGGTALANLVICLVAYGLALRWPPLSRKPYWGRQAALAVVHYLLVNLCVRFAAGPHPWGWGWLWVLLFIPAWASLAFRLHPPLHRK